MDASYARQSLYQHRQILSFTQNISMMQEECLCHINLHVIKLRPCSKMAIEINLNVEQICHLVLKMGRFFTQKMIIQINDEFDF